MSKTTIQLKKRPELVQLPSVPTILKISEVPSGFSVIRINLPFTLTHLAHAGVKKAFIFAETGKSPMTILGEQNAILNQMKKEVINKIIDRYPKLYKHVTLAIIAHIRYGSRSGHGQPFSPSYISDIPKLVETLEECGFSKVHLTVKICACMDREENSSTSELIPRAPADCGLSELLEWTLEQRDKEILGE